MPEHIQRPHVDNIEALKAPVFFQWELLGYGTPRELSEKGIKRVWIGSKYRSRSDSVSLIDEVQQPLQVFVICSIQIVDDLLLAGVGVPLLHLTCL